ncbi:hypothetical protein NKH84_24180 [Mesorhizobium sp. M0902]|uniref:ABC-three component system protein n=1 Tax=unclassified Mesorhizobium TaxID=325217 RepID=UPI00333707F5
MTSKDKFNASGSLAGYLFQCRLALLLGLQMVKKKANGHISIEKFDDIAFDTEDFVDCLIQAKHHVAKKELTDTSVDVWKTLRIWIKSFKESPTSNSEIKRIIITTSIAPEHSGLSKLRPLTSKEKRIEAREDLKTAARTSNNKDSKIGRSEFLSLSDQEVDLLLSSIDLLDDYPNLPDVMDEIAGELVLLAPSHAEKVAASLEGWWLGAVAKRLVGEDDSSISLQDVIKKANEIGKWFGPDGLPVSDPETLGDKPYHPDDEDEIYVRQMRLIKLPETAIRRGIRDYYRSHAQRSKWARESLLIDGEASRYDAKLIDQWERRFEADCAGCTADDELRAHAGRSVYFWANQHQIGFRNVVETWITAGSYHALADRLDVGWHPDFQHHLGNRDANGKP